MLKNVYKVTLAVLLLVTPSLVFAQYRSSGKWWRMSSVVKRLNLSDDEVQQLEEAFRQSKRKFIQLKSRLQIEQFELENLMDSKSLDDEAINKQYEKLEKARADLGMERFRFLLKVRKIVGYERFQELVSVKKNHSHKRGGHRDKNSLTQIE